MKVGKTWVRYMNRLIQLASALCTIIVVLILKPHYTFSFFAILSLSSICLSLTFFQSKEKISYNLEYLAVSSLILSSSGFLLDFLTSTIYFYLGILILASSVGRHKKIYSEDLTIMLLAFLGFWIIYYKFADLGYIAFLLGLNVALLIGFLSHTLLTENMEEEIALTQ
jgi:hypothetical protein